MIDEEDCVERDGRRSDPRRRPEEMDRTRPNERELMLPWRRAPGAGTELALRLGWVACG